MNNISFYSNEELASIGLKSFGTNVLISRKISIYGGENISIGNNVRIDDFCILSGSITIGSYIHISAYTALYGGKDGIFIDDFSGISARCTLYAQTDDFSGQFMVGVMINNNLRNIITRKIQINKFVQIGANCVILPGVSIKEGVAVGALSLINSSLEEWSIYGGIPCKKIKKRAKRILSLKKELDE